jgi:hypothetical protein
MSSTMRGVFPDPNWNHTSVSPHRQHDLIWSRANYYYEVLDIELLVNPILVFDVLPPNKCALLCTLLI